MGGSIVERWRIIDCGAVTPFENAAMMPVLSRNVAGGADPIATTSIWGQAHLNVGWFDDVDSTPDLDACARLGIAVIRRPMYGGGTAFYDAGCAVMWGFLLPKERYDDLDAALARFQPVAFEDRVVDLVERVAAELGNTTMRLPAGAGHDAQMLARVCPTGMVFVPSHDGISHNPREHTTPTDLAAGTTILLDVLLSLAT